MIRMIDATLCMLDDYPFTREQICYFVELMRGIGINSLQISIALYEKLEGNLPDGMNYYLEVDTISYINENYPKDKKIKYYFTPKQRSGDREIEAYQINDMEEPLRIVPVAEDALLKVTGLDNLLLGGCCAGLESLKKRFSLKQLILCPEDTYHCATAIAVLFLQNKGYAVVSSLLGIGNKASTEQILMALHVIDRYMVKRNFENFSKLKCWLEEVLEDTVSPMAPVVGNRIFHVESGVHVDGILKKPSNYEPYPPELVGLKREVILGKHSGKSSVDFEIKKLNMESALQDHAEELLQMIKEKSRARGTAITEEEFIEMAGRYELYEKET